MTPLPRPRRPWDRTAPADREYFDLLGPGLVSILPARRPGTGGGGWTPPHGGAWVHIGANGRIRGFTGKAEVGQGTRTALTLVVADALDTEPSRVDLWMGDTDVCPWDMGTFGSRSMPDAAPALYAAARGARDALVELAAGRLGLKADALEVSGGSLRQRGGGASVTIAHLLEGQRLVYTAEPVRGSLGHSEGGVIGRATPELLGREIVTGTRRYASDVRRPGMLEGAVLWPPVLGARMKRADLTRLRARPGLVVVEENGWVGVAAGSAAAARSALGAAEVEWDRPAYPGEAEIEGYLERHPSRGDDWDAEDEAAGDAGRAIASAPIQVGGHFRTAFIAHVPLEPRCAVAEWDGPRLTVWVGTQTPFRARAQVAERLGVSEDDVRVIVPPTGAGFGGKHGGEISTAAARLARAAGRPVRVAFTREEEFQHGYLRPMSVIDVRAGLTPDGRLAGWTFHNLNGGAACLLSPYVVQDRTERNTLSDSPMAQGPYRSLAANANNFARETILDELARASHIDPVELRRRNLDDPRLLRVLDVAARRAAWSARGSEPGVGWGLAIGREKEGRVATVAQVSVDRARRLRVERLVSAFEAGTIVNPDNLQSQVEGSHVMALGGALFEALHFQDGVLTNPRLSLYRVPRFSDLPDIEVELIDDRDHPPAGAGETPMIAVAPAIGNAIFDATGVRRHELPLLVGGKVPREA